MADHKGAVTPEGTPQESHDPREGSFALRRELLRELEHALQDRHEARAHELVEPLHSADLADLIGLLGAGERRIFIEICRAKLEPEVLSELDESVRDEVLKLLPHDDVSAAVAELESDDAVYLLENLDEARQREILEELPAQSRAALEQGLSYPEDSAGRLMQRSLIAAPPYWTVGQTIDFMRESVELTYDFYEIFVVDPKYHPIGTVPLSRIMSNRRPVNVQDIMETDMRLIPVEMDQEEVSYLFQQYHLLSAPVVDGEGRLVGVITVDDVVDVIQEEADEDIRFLAGVQEGGIDDSVVAITRTRFSWLAVNLVTAILASVVIALFDTAIEKLVALAILMPIVASMGGNAGTQGLTVAVRALATRDLTAHNAARIVIKEILVGCINGVLLAILVGIVAALWFGDPVLGSVLAAAMVINLIAAGMAGILVPLGLGRIGVDPAVASSVFVTTITDIVGFGAFLGLAVLFLL